MFNVGDRVTPDPNGIGVPRQTLGRVFRVAKVNPKNLKCTAEDGGRGINFPARILLPFEGNMPEQPPAPARERFVMGEIVTLNRPFRDITTETPMVVIADKGNKVNVARLGGDGDKYVRVFRTSLTRRDRAWLTHEVPLAA